MTDFVCIGDATRDLFLFLKETPVFNGSKIPVEDIAWSLGGNAANVSVGLTSLGLKTSLVTVFGDDERGAWIKRELMKDGVDLTSSTTETERVSNLSTIMVVRGERTIFSYHSQGQKQVENLPESQWLYLTSSPGRNSDAIFKLAIQSQAKIAFNPGVEDLKQGRNYLQPVLDKTEVLILNKEEQEMLGAMGPKITVITDGAKGAKVIDNKNTISKPAINSQVVEVTGAGDAFSSGFLAALFYGKDLETALEWGIKNSGGVVEKVGSTAGLLNRGEIER